MERREGSFVGHHEPLVTESEYWRAQDILGKRGRPRSKQHQFAYRGLISCGDCGCAITAEAKVNRFGSRYVYYHCTHRRPCGQPSIEVRALEDQIQRYLDRLTVSPAMLDWAVTHLEEAGQAHRAEAAAVRASLEAAIAGVTRQLGTLTQLRLKELITDSEFATEKTRLRSELAHLESQRQPPIGGSAHEPLAAVAVLALAALAHEWFRAGDADLRHELLDLIGSNLSLKDKTLSIEARKPFLCIANGPFGLRTNSGPLEPQESPASKRSATALTDKNSLVGARVYDARTHFPGFNSLRLPSKKAVAGFAELLHAEYKRPFEEAEVHEIGARLLRLMRLLMRPLPKKDMLEAA